MRGRKSTSGVLTTEEWSPHARLVHAPLIWVKWYVQRSEELTGNTIYAKGLDRREKQQESLRLGTVEHELPRAFNDSAPASEADER